MLQRTEWIGSMCGERELDEMTWEQIARLAVERGVLDEWRREGDTIDFFLGNKHARVEVAGAKPFARGLLRGYEMASRTSSSDDPD